MRKPDTDPAALVKSAAPGHAAGRLPPPVTAGSPPQRLTKSVTLAAPAEGRMSPARPSSTPEVNHSRSTQTRSEALEREDVARVSTVARAAALHAKAGTTAARHPAASGWRSPAGRGRVAARPSTSQSWPA